MIKKYPKINTLSKLKNQLNTIKGRFALFCAVVLIAPAIESAAQTTYTLGTGNLDNNTIGVTPFSTSNRNSRNQYLYLGQELTTQDAISGNIISLALNVTSLALPTSLKPENIVIKMGMTYDVALGETMVPNLPVYYTTSSVNITTTGWYTFVLDTPFEWDGIQNIIVEICRTNADFGTSYGVQSTFYLPTDYRNTGLFSTDPSQQGCSLTGTTNMPGSDRRTRPNMRMTMTNPCTDTPAAGVTAVTASNSYCEETPFTLTVQNGSIESGLAYQWQEAPAENGPWTNITGAFNTAYTTTQAIATWYRRATTCLETQQTIYSEPLLVGGAGCYCTALVTNENPIGITNVTFNTINNNSASTPAYSNFTTQQTIVNKESSYNLSVNVNTNGGTNYTMAWIDWDRNGSYDASEAYSLGNVTGGANVNSGTVANITVPATAVEGITRMRVRTSQSSENLSPEACGPIANGEAEDYAVRIDPALSVGDFNPAGIAVIVNAVPDGLKIDVRDEVLSSVSVFDLSGRMLTSAKNINKDSATLFVNAKSQLLLVKIVTTSGAVVNKKVIL